MLGFNQLALLGLIVAYAAWMLGSVLLGPNPYAEIIRREPMTADHPLLRLRHPERLLITPHIAWSSREAREALLAGVCANIREYLEQHGNH